jgi:alpha-amylase
VTSVVFYFQVHQPYRLQRYTYFDIGGERDYFNGPENERILKRVAERCYLPMNALLLETIESTEGRFRCAFSLTGTVLSQLEDQAPEALDSFVALARTGCVEFLCETAYHSLASVGDQDEFEAQVVSHRDRVEALFGTRPVTFRNTELIFDDAIAKTVERLGFEALLGEGADHLLAGRSPRRVWQPRGAPALKLLLRDYLFSDDIAFRFSNRKWDQYPLMADTFASWLHKALPDDAFIGLFMDYETFGEHQGPATGIFEFMRHVPGYLLADGRFDFRTPAEVARAHPSVGEIAAPEPVSWADAERDLSAWLRNPMQRSAHDALYDLLPDVREAARLGHPELLSIWRRLTTSDHVYYMSTKGFGDGEVHRYFSPHESTYEAYVAFSNALCDLAGRVGLATWAPPA